MVNQSVYFAYLRKSREDRDAEMRGEGETLERHRKILSNLADRMGIIVSAWYQEVVSGETIAARPQMIRMLNDIESLCPAGVLVVEIERLARGDTRDQGLIMETFKYAGTKIITPNKTYDPNDEFDEEYAEFGLFMSRREYKTINRRLQRGRKISISEGKWTGNKTPYGYERVKIENDKGFTLKIVPEEANIVRLIHQLYNFGSAATNNLPVGVTAICRILDQEGIAPPSGKNWSSCTIRGILENPVYIGKIQSGKRKQEKRMVDGKLSISRPINHQVEIFDGLHPGIVDPEVFALSVQKRKESYRKPFYEGIKNPLAGLIYCAECGKSMYRRPAGKRCRADSIICITPGCPTSASYYSLIEERLLQAMAEWLDDYRVQIVDNSFAVQKEQLEFLRTRLAQSQAEEDGLKAQLSRAMELLEKDVYTIEMFQERATDLNGRIAMARKNIQELSRKISELEKLTADHQEVIQRWERVLAEFPHVQSGADKNALLKEVLSKVEYSKPKRGTRFGGQDNFTLKIYPRL